MYDILLPSHKVVSVKPVTGKAEALFEDKKLIQSGAVVDRFMAECIEAVDGKELGSPQEKIKAVMDLYTGDRNYLLLKLRVEAYGPKMVFNYACPSCKETSGYEADLDEMLANGELEVHDYSPSPIQVDLPRSGGCAEVRHLTGHDERKAFGMDLKGTFSATLPLTSSLNGEPPTIKALKELPAGDLLAIRQAALSLKGGLDPSIELKCLDCGTKYRVKLGAIPDFFTPTRTTLESAGL